MANRRQNWSIAILDKKSHIEALLLNRVEI